uniref:(California timema) hypothetical protein n=1 Tax=Timema californicum TaxID=61474 RepID=A0A7R9JD37_TIMCA|nr:unnamed protein product [Timema californicum]
MEVICELSVSTKEAVGLVYLTRADSRVGPAMMIALKEGVAIPNHGYNTKKTYNNNKLQHPRGVVVGIGGGSISVASASIHQHGSNSGVARNIASDSETRESFRFVSRTAVTGQSLDRAKPTPSAGEESDNFCRYRVSCCQNYVNLSFLDRGCYYCYTSRSSRHFVLTRLELDLVPDPTASQINSDAPGIELGTPVSVVRIFDY